MKTTEPHKWPWDWTDFHATRKTSIAQQVLLTTKGVQSVVVPYGFTGTITINNNGESR